MFKTTEKAQIQISEAVTRKCSVKKVFLTISENSSGLGPATLLKKEIWHRCFLLNLRNFERKPPVAVSEIFLLHDVIVRTPELNRMTK